MTGLGGLLSGLPVFAAAPEAEGHGTDAVIAALHHRGETIHMWVPPVKLIASAITSGTGGTDLGRLRLAGEPLAPAGCPGAAALPPRHLGGAALAAEILYPHERKVEAVVAALIAASVGYTT